MAMSPEEYQQAGLQLLPTGKAWDKELTSETSKLQLGFGYEFSRIETTGESLLKEAFPDNTMLLLKEWEAFAGLPDCTVDETATIAMRRHSLSTKLRMVGSLSSGFLEKIAAERGYTIQIIDRYPHHIKRGITYPLYPKRNWWLAFVVVKNVTRHNMTVLDGIKTKLVVKDYGDLECLLERYKPAHINLIYVDEVP